MGQALKTGSVISTLRPLIKVAPGFVVSTKPATGSCEEATRYRVNRTNDNRLGVELDKEIKTLIYASENNLRIYITSANYMISESEMSLHKLSLLPRKLMDKIGLQPFAVNPINTFNFLRKTLAKLPFDEVNVVVNPKIFEQEFFTNNLGSRYLSCSVEQRGYWDTVCRAIEKFKASIGNDVHILYREDCFFLTPSKVFEPEERITSSKIILVSPEVASDLKYAALTVQSQPHIDFEEFLKQSLAVTEGFHQHFSDQITCLKSGNEQPYLIFKGLPQDEVLPATPTTVIAHEKQTYISESILMGMNQCFGQPFSYKYEKEGQCIHNICPNPIFEQTQSNQGSKVTFGFHQEMAFHLVKPDFLLLYCLREDHDKSCLTTLLDMRDVLANTPTDVLDVLRQPLFKINVPTSYQREDWKPDWVPLISGSTIVLAEHCHIDCKTEVAEHALQTIRELLDRYGTGIHLEPGDLLVIDNHRMLHGRSIFSPMYDGIDRWLQRSYCHTNLDAAAETWPNSRRVFE